MKSAQGLVDADGITNGLPEGNDTAMKTKANRKIITNKAQIDDRHAITGRLLCWYTFLFIVFYAAVFSPFWVYGKACLWGTDGINQQLPTLTYSKQWYAGVMQNLLQGNVEIPYWSMEIGFGQNTFLNAINIRFFNLLFALFPYSAIEFFLLFRVVLSLYLTGIAFILYGRTRVRNDADLLLGCMLYVFSSFTIYFAVRHTFFLEMTITMPLMLLGVDQIYDGKWSPWFIFAVALEGLSNFYLLFMITVPAVVYAAFHFFELRPQERSERGGLIRILLRHIVQYVIGLCLAAISLLPSILMVLGSSRTSSQSGVSMLHWRRNVYLSFFRGIVGMEEIGIYGFIALPSIALLGVLFLMRSKKTVHLEDTLYRYRVGQPSTMHNQNIRMNLDILEIMENLRETMDPEKDRDDFEFLLLNHVLLEAIKRVSAQEGPEKRECLALLRDYVHLHIPRLSACPSFRAEPRNRRIIMELNYRGLDGLGQTLLKLKK